MVFKKTQTLEYVYQTLKPIIDKSVVQLRAFVESGERASDEYKVIERQMMDLHLYITNNRYDRETVLDAERDLCDYEAQTSGVSKKIARGKSAVKQLQYVKQFYKNYDKIIIAPKMAKLEHARQNIEDRMDKLSERIFACSENMDASQRGSDIAVQYTGDMLKYEAEYAELTGQLKSICNEMAQLQHK